MSKYDPLNRFLSQQSSDRITLTFSEIEAVLGFTLPASAHRHTAWWSNSNTKAHPYSQAWTDAGFYTVDVSTTQHAEKITFEKR